MSEDLEVYVGFRSPSRVDRDDAMHKAAVVASDAPWRPIPRHTLSTHEFEWEGFKPRWADENTTECVAALLPAGDYDSHRSQELERYLSAALERGEPAILLCELGTTPLGPPRGSTREVSLVLPILNGVARGRPLPTNPRLNLPENLQGPERDLALRLRNSRQDDPWYALEMPTVDGHFLPLLVTDIDEVVVAAWRNPSETQIWYMLPPRLPWSTILRWLEGQALPEFAPRALARARRRTEEEFLTQDERDAREHLEEFDRQVAEERAALQDEIASARAWAEQRRRPLLYGTARELEEAVAAVLEEAELSVERLDDTFGAGRSGDLLISSDQRHWLVEVKSSSGGTSEAEVGKLEAHLETWPRLRSEALEGGVLVVNHNYRAPPAGRPPAPYHRPEFVESLNVRVIGTIPLCRWWAQRDFKAIVRALTGGPGQVARDTEV